MKRLLWLVMSAVVVTAVGVCDVLAAAAQTTTSGTTVQNTMPATGAPSAMPGTGTPRQPATNDNARAVAPNAVSGTAAPMAAGGAPSDYVIGPEDVLQVSVWKNESLSRIVPVRPDGKISLPLLHDIQAAGLTAMQLRDKLAVALAEYMPNPEVSVIVNEVRSFRVSVLGEVQKPGVLQLKSTTTILEALAMAGGFRDFASPSKIVIFRRDDTGQTQKIKFNYNKAVGSSSTFSLTGDRNASDDQNLVLKTGDVIVVP
jgi:polysaccharide biosynthesis/export protein